MSDSPTPSDDTPAEPMSWPAAWCLHCGYDLRGLELPHPCPECGRVADPEREREVARAYVRGWKSWFWWIMAPQEMPAGLLYLLDDPKIRRVARRRSLLCLWLPTILGMLLVLVPQQYIIEHTLTAHYFRISDPGKKTVFERDYKQENRPFFSFLKIYNGFENDEHEGYDHTVTYSLDRIHLCHEFGIDPKSIRYFSPLWIALIGIVTLSLALRVQCWRSDRKAEFLPISSSVRAAYTIMMSALGLAFWLWFAMLSCLLLMYLLHGGDLLSSLAEILVGAAGICIFLVVAPAIPNLLEMDRAHRLFASPVVGGVVLYAAFAMGAGTAALAFKGITRLHWMFFFGM